MLAQIMQSDCEEADNIYPMDLQRTLPAHSTTTSARCVAEEWRSLAATNAARRMRAAWARRAAKSRRTLCAALTTMIRSCWVRNGGLKTCALMTRENREAHIHQPDEVLG